MLPLRGCFLQGPGRDLQFLPGLQWLLDEGAADGRVLHHLGEEKQEYENNRIVEKERSSLRVEQALGKHLPLANTRTVVTLVTGCPSATALKIGTTFCDILFIYSFFNDLY